MAKLAENRLPVLYGELGQCLARDVADHSIGDVSAAANEGLPTRSVRIRYMRALLELAVEPVPTEHIRQESCGPV
jgi:hypothetical protein